MLLAKIYNHLVPLQRTLVELMQKTPKIGLAVTRQSETNFAVLLLALLKGEI